MGRAHGGERLPMRTKAVQQVALYVLAYQGLVFVLAVDVHQAVTEFAQGLQGYGAGIDEGAGTSLAGDDAA